jgi:hypothetical protein
VWSGLHAGRLSRSDLCADIFKEGGLLGEVELSCNPIAPVASACVSERLVRKNPKNLFREPFFISLTCQQSGFPIQDSFRNPGVSRCGYRHFHT